MNTQLFRKVSLERLSSPEQLDVLMKVASPLGWLSLLSVGILLAVALIWGLLGSIPATVNGNGILLRAGGVFNIECVTSGQVSAIYVSVGDSISKNQLIARVAQPKLISEINKDKDRLGQLKEEQERFRRFSADEMNKKMEYYAKQRTDFENSIKLSQETLKWLYDRLQNQESLLEQNLIRRQDYLNTKKEIYDTKVAIDKLHQEIKQVSIDEVEYKHRQRIEISNKKHEIDQLKTLIESKEDELDLKSRVVSSYSGSVVELLVSEGSFINSGDAILTLELGGYNLMNLEAVFYIAAGDGKKVRPGMKAQVSPATVKREEWGCMLGLVTSVSVFPTTQKGMLRNLQNQKLVESFSSGGAPIEITVDLVPDASSVSGYKWTTSKGPPITVEHGTICTATVTVSEQPPIQLVIPLLKRFFLGIGS